MVIIEVSSMVMSVCGAFPDQGIHQFSLDFQLSVQKRWDARTTAAESPPTDEKSLLSLENEDEEFLEEFNGVIEPDESMDESIELGPDDFLNMEVGMNLEEQGFRHGKVKKRAVDAD